MILYCHLVCTKNPVQGYSLMNHHTYSHPLRAGAYDESTHEFTHLGAWLCLAVHGFFFISDWFCCRCSFFAFMFKTRKNITWVILCKGWGFKGLINLNCVEVLYTNPYGHKAYKLGWKVSKDIRLYFKWFFLNSILRWGSFICLFMVICRALFYFWVWLNNLKSYSNCFLASSVHILDLRLQIFLERGYFH